MATAIEWTRAPDGTRGDTWNPIKAKGGGWACVKVSPECAHCYAERLNLSSRFGGNGKPFLPGRHAEPELVDDDRLFAPLAWKRPRRIFVCSMTDLFWDAIPDHWIEDVFEVMFEATQHNFLVLTKRAERMATFVARWMRETGAPALPPHIWVGVTAGNQTQAELRLPDLLKVPAAVRFVSAEPLLGPIDLGTWLVPAHPTVHPQVERPPAVEAARRFGWGGVDWVIAGGESGGPARRALVETCREPGRCIAGRPDHRACPRCAGTGWRPKRDAYEWAVSLLQQCELANTAFFWKQFGGPTPKSGGRLLAGREWSQWPDDPGAPYAVLPPFTAPPAGHSVAVPPRAPRVRTRRTLTRRPRDPL